MPALPEATNCTRKFLRLGKSNAADAVYGGVPEVIVAKGYALWFTLERRQNWLITPLILAGQEKQNGVLACRHLDCLADARMC